MSIAIDARGSQTGHAARGIGRVIRELVDAIAAFDAADRADVVVVGDAAAAPGLRHRAARAVTVGGLLSPGRADFAGADVIVRLAPTAPSSLDRRSVVCCFDVIPLKAMGEHFPLLRRLRHPLNYVTYGYGLASIENAAHVWTISRAVADDVHRLLGVPRARLTPIGLAPAALPVPDAARRRERVSALGLAPDAFLLWVLGGTNENKNVGGMLDVMACGPLPPLCIVGGHPPHVQRRVAASARRKRAPSPRFLGHVDNETLAALMHEARAVVVPSKDEGFGLPVVEARACGARVVANDIAVLREVGDADVTYVDIDDAAAFAAALRAAGGPRRISAGRTWRDTAAEVIALARRAARRG